MEKKHNKYSFGDIQNEALQIMALSILREISSSLRESGWFTIMADECTDVSNKEHFVICFCWVDADLCAHEYIIGLYYVAGIIAITLVSSIEDALLRLSLNLSHSHGQCYDGASNMAGSKSGVAASIREKEPI